MLAKTLFVLFFCFVVYTCSANIIPIVDQSSLASKRLWAVNPSFKLSLPQFAINYIVASAVPVLERKLQSLPVPDVTGETDTPIGKIGYSLTNIRINSFKLGSDAMTITNNGLSWNMQGVNSNLHMDWHWKKEHGAVRPSDHGSADVSMTMHIFFNIIIQYDPSSPSHLKISVQDFQFQFNSFNLKLHGGTSWLYNIFIKSFRGNIEKAIQKSVSSQVSKQVNEQLEKVLASLDLVFPVGHYGIIGDFSFRSVKFAAQNYMSFGLAGDFRYKDCPVYAGEPAIMPDISAIPSMMQFFLSEWMLNNMGSALYKSGHLHKTITQADIPDKVPIQLNTTFFKFMLPKLYDLYPSCEMKMYILAGNVTDTDPMKDPSFDIASSGVTSSLEAATILQVVAQNGTIVNAITLGMMLEAAAKFSIVNESTLIGEMSLNNMNITLQKSIIGPIDISLLKVTLTSIVNYVVVPAFNVLLASGIPLPVPKMKEFNLSGSPSIMYDDQFMGIYANFTLTPNNF